MLFLTIDSVMNACSTGIYDSDHDVMITQKLLQMPRGQAEHLMPMVEEIIRKAQITYEELEGVAVTKGPGAFTGMRIGLATAKTLGLVLGIPVIGVSTFRSLLGDFRNHECVGVLLETKRQDFYFQLFEEGEEVVEGMACSSLQVMQVLQNKCVTLIGDANERFRYENSDFDDKNIYYYDILAPLPIEIGRCAAVSGQLNEMPEPAYLRMADVSFSNKSPRQIKQKQIQL